MTEPNLFAVLLLSYISLERLSEVVIAAINTRRLKARGAYEVAPRHYPLFFGLNGLWIGGLWALGYDRAPILPWVAVYACLEALRLWVMLSLGERWTTRIIILPGAPLVRRGPYQFLSHPNYVVVAGEILVAPLCFAQPVFAAVFTLANAALLVIRIRAENRALKTVSPLP